MSSLHLIYEQTVKFGQPISPSVPQALLAIQPSVTSDEWISFSLDYNAIVVDSGRRVKRSRWVYPLVVLGTALVGAVACIAILGSDGREPDGSVKIQSGGDLAAFATFLVGAIIFVALQGRAILIEKQIIEMPLEELATRSNERLCHGKDTFNNPLQMIRLQVTNPGKGSKIFKLEFFAARRPPVELTLPAADCREGQPSRMENRLAVDTTAVFATV